MGIDILGIDILGIDIVALPPVAYLPYFFTPTLNIKMVFGEKIPKMGTFSDFVTIFFVKSYSKI